MNKKRVFKALRLLTIAGLLAGLCNLSQGAGPATAAPALDFAVAVQYTAGDVPVSVAVGDFDRDGNPDMAVANHNSHNVSVLLGNGDGTFQAAVNYAAGNAPRSVAVGDFDRDGNPDLAAANRNSNNVSVLLGNGDGTFQVAVNYAAGNTPFSVTVDDFDRDGNPDMATANVYGDNVSVLLGDGDGTFQVAINYAVGDGSLSVAVGDFDRDGSPDLATANYNSDDVSVLLGKGDGTFQAAANHAVGDGPYSIAVGDFDCDGSPDLATANALGNNVSVLLGDGDGTFQAAANHDAGDGPFAIAMGDFDRDGNPDLATANAPSDSVSVLLGNGDGTFQVAVNYAVGDGPLSVAMGDFDRDGKPDLATANQSSDDVSVLLNTAPPPQLSLVKTAVPQSDVPYHDVVTYTLALRNNGAGNDANVVLTDTLPAQVNFDGWIERPTGANVAGDEITWSGVVTASTATTFTFQVRHTGNYGEVVTNTAEFSGTLQAGTDWATFRVMPASALTADLAISKSLRIGFLTNVTFTIVARNLGPAAAHGAVVSDTLPSNVISATWACTHAGGATCTVSGSGNISQTLTAFPYGGVVTYTVRGALTRWDTVTNTAHVVAPSGVTDPYPDNNRASAYIHGYFLPIVLRNH